MNRRDFFKALGGLAAVVALPMGAQALAAATYTPWETTFIAFGKRITIRSPVLLLGATGADFQWINPPNPPNPARRQWRPPLDWPAHLRRPYEKGLR